MDGLVLMWKFLRPDRWDNLPAAVLEQPGLYNHLLSFSAGPRVNALVLILYSLTNSILSLALECGSQS